MHQPMASSCMSQKFVVSGVP